MKTFISAHCFDRPQVCSFGNNNWTQGRR